MKTSTLIVFAALSGLLFGTGCSGPQPAGDRLPTVRTGVAETYGAGTQLEFPGRVKAAQEVNLGFQVGGTLQRFAAGEGSFVREGELLAALDDRDYRLQLEAAEAEYNRIRAEAERVMALYADSAVTADTYDKARYGLRQITAKYENCKNQLADTRITAPFDGYVQRKLFDAPTVVAAGMPVVTFISSAAAEVEINIPGAEYVRRGEFAAFEASFDFWPGRRIPLRLLSISPKANANQLYTVRLGLSAGEEPAPAPGMNTMVGITFRPAGEARTVVPASAVFSRDGRSCVWICRADSTVTGREVQVERLHTDGSALLGPGLSAGERVVTSGVHQLHEGAKVAPLGETSETNVGGLL